MDRLRAICWIAWDSALPIASRIVALVLEILAVLLRPVSQRTAMRLIMAGYRAFPNQRRRNHLSSVASDVETMAPLAADVARPEGARHRMIVLLRPTLVDDRIRHGVLLIKFTETAGHLIHRVDLAELQKYFRLVIEPSWSGYAVPEILYYQELQDPVVVEAAEREDRRLLERVSTRLIPVPLGSGDWVDYRTFRPLGLAKKYDAAYVANYSPGKRIHAFLRAVRDINRAGTAFRALLVCGRWGPGRQVISEMLSLFDVEDSVDTMEGLTPDALNRALNQARISVLMSRKEGSNRSLFEGMFAGLPALLLAENFGVNRDRITPKTGMIVAEAELPRKMLELSQTSEDYSPRAWAMEHISPEVSTRVLGEFLDSIFPQDGGAHARLAVKMNRPELMYLTSEGSRSGSELSDFVLHTFSSDDPRDTSAAQVVGEIARLAPFLSD